MTAAPEGAGATVGLSRPTPAPFEIYPLKFASVAELATYRAALAKLDEALAILPKGTYRVSLLRTSEWMRRELRERNERQRALARAAPSASPPPVDGGAPAPGREGGAL